MNKIFALLAILTLIPIATAQAETVTQRTSDDSLDVRIDTKDAQAGQETKMKVEFLNIQTGQVQVHIDYSLKVENDGQAIFGPIPLTHTSLGTVTIPVTFEDGTNTVTIDVEGILFMPIPKETVSFDVVIGDESKEIPEQKSERVPAWVKNNAAWWADGQIDDNTFVSGIQFLIKEKIIDVSASPDSEGKSEEQVPAWVKNNAKWWAEGMITEDDFLKGIEFLVSKGIIAVATEVSEPQILEIGGVDISNASPFIGSSDAPVTIIEFGDYQCPNCKKWFQNTKPDIVTNYIETGKANLYFVDAAHIGSDSISAARASYCAQDQGKYWEYHDTLYANYGGIQNGWADIPSLKEYAISLGLDSEQFDSCIDSSNHEDRVEANNIISSENGVKRTPSFVIVGPNGQEMISGNQPYSTFESVIDSLLES